MVKEREAGCVAVHGVTNGLQHKESDTTEQMNKNNKPRCRAIWEGSITVKWNSSLIFLVLSERGWWTELTGKN